MATYNKFQDFVEQLGKGVHNFSSHTVKAMLTNTAPNAATNTVKADITEISAGGGYSAGGFTLASLVWSETGGTASLAAADYVFTATGAVGPFRYVVIYNDTPTSPADPLIAWWDYGSSFSMATGETFTIDFGTNIFTLT